MIDETEIDHMGKYLKLSVDDLITGLVRSNDRDSLRRIATVVSELLKEKLEKGDAYGCYLMYPEKRRSE